MASTTMAAISTRWIRIIRFPRLIKFSDKPPGAWGGGIIHFCGDGNLLADHSSKQHPALAVKTGQLYLLDRIEIGWTGIDLDTRQQHGNFEILEPRRLSHDIFVRQIVTALPENANHSLRRRVAVYV